LETTNSHAAPSAEVRIAQLEKQVATLRSEVDELKALQKQAIFLKNCVAKEKSTNNLKVALKLASCTVEYFKKSKESVQKTKK
jgi:cell fate (sporulation/competence/biofilm development) regulator YmcA (YheA/YmcA/DUF963 family)